MAELGDDPPCGTHKRGGKWLRMGRSVRSLGPWPVQGRETNLENGNIKGVEYGRNHRSDWLDLDMGVMAPAVVPQ